MNAKGKGRIGNGIYQVNTDGGNEIENKRDWGGVLRLMKEMQMKQKVRGEENCQVHQESESVTNENTIKNGNNII